MKFTSLSVIASNFSVLRLRSANDRKGSVSQLIKIAVCTGLHSAFVALNVKRNESAAAEKDPTLNLQPNQPLPANAGQESSLPNDVVVCCCS